MKKHAGYVAIDKKAGGGVKASAINSLESLRHHAAFLFIRIYKSLD